MLSAHATTACSCKMAHLEDALAALELTLTGEHMQSLQAPYQPRPIAGFA